MRTTIGFANARREKKRSVAGLAAELVLARCAGTRGTGSPAPAGARACAAPWARPRIVVSSSSVLNTRAAPKRFQQALGHAVDAALLRDVLAEHDRDLGYLRIISCERRVDERRERLRPAGAPGSSAGPPPFARAPPRQRRAAPRRARRSSVVSGASGAITCSRVASLAAPRPRAPPRDPLAHRPSSASSAPARVARPLDEAQRARRRAGPAPRAPRSPRARDTRCLDVAARVPEQPHAAEVQQHRRAPSPAGLDRVRRPRRGSTHSLPVGREVGECRQAPVGLLDPALRGLDADPDPVVLAHEEHRQRRAAERRPARGVDRRRGRSRG